MKFTIDGREYEDYELSNEQIVRLLEGKYLEMDDTHVDSEKKEFLMKKVYERFKYNLCPKSGEDNNDVFAHFFSNYVNRCPNDFKKAASVMGREHRYLQNEMFKVCMAYIKVLKEAYKEKQYDGRNEYAVKTANMILSFLDAEKWPY